jgi:hypothetical protein
MPLIRKRRITHHMIVNRPGEIKTDQIKLPANAYRVNRILVSVVPIEASILVQNFENYFFGVGSGATLDATLFNDLTMANYPTTTHTINFILSPGANDYVFYAHPVSALEPVFVYETFQGGFLEVGIFNIMIPDVGTIAYRLWRSVNSNLGTNLTITAQHP